MKKLKILKPILLTLFVFKILLIPSFANYDLEAESKLWEKLDKNLNSIYSFLKRKNIITDKQVSKILNFFS